MHVVHGRPPEACATCAIKPRYLMHDGTARFRKGDQEIYQYAPARDVLRAGGRPAEVSVIPIRKDAPLDVVCLVSCGVMAGAGAVITGRKSSRAPPWRSGAAAASA